MEKTDDTRALAAALAVRDYLMPILCSDTPPTKDLGDEVVRLIAAEYAPLVEAARQRDEAHGYLSRLFAQLAPQCGPFDDLPSLCAQIDNYIAGLKDKAREMLDSHSIQADYESADSGARRIAAKRALRAALDPK